MIRCLLVFLLAIGSVSLVQAEDADVAQQIQKIQLEQEYAKKEASLLQSALKEQIQTIHQAQENKIEKVQHSVDKVQQDVNYHLMLWGLGGIAIGAVIAFFATLWWKTKDLPEIVAKEVAKHRDTMTQELEGMFSKYRKEVQESLEKELAADTQKIKAGLHWTIESSLLRIEHEKNSKILILTNGEDKGLQDLLLSYGFPVDHIIQKSLSEVFLFGQESPNDTDYDLVILDSFDEDIAHQYIEAGKLLTYLLYYEGQYKLRPNANRSIVANSKPTVYGHAMTLLHYNDSITV